MSEKKAENLPWKKPKSGTFDFTKKNDFQTNMVDGQIEVFAWSIGAKLKDGIWVYFKLLNYAKTGMAEINYTVNVDKAAYSKWNKTNPFSGNNPPAGASGSTGGKCDAAWTKGGGGSTGEASSDDGGGGAGGKPCNQAQSFTCQAGGGNWDAANCKCIKKKK
ncbi:MAG: hypothetical protein GY859_30460 [Desulfobacterales bacterium]|nr:hypothetical protein [Desulfobacterales bacterium]